jgi:hypothetical protein
MEVNFFKSLFILNLLLVYKGMERVVGTGWSGLRIGTGGGHL